VTPTSVRTLVLARIGRAVYVDQGSQVRVVDVEGQQVGDLFAYVLGAAGVTGEHLSASHTRTFTSRLFPAIGESFVTNRRRPILTLVEDTSGGIHDTLMAACDRYRYAFLGVEGHHDNCADNLIAALADVGMASPHVPSPLNLFMNIPWTEQGGLSFAAPPRSVPGSYVVLRAEMDLTIAFSACPQDILPINGKAGKPTEAHFQIE